MRKVYKKQSLWSKIVNFSLIFFHDKANSSTEEAAKKFIEKSQKKKMKKYFFEGFNCEKIGGSYFYSYNGSLNKCKDKVLLYVHGGNYVEHPNLFQVIFAKKIAKKTNSTLIFPIYDLLPHGNYKKMHDLLSNIYSAILEKKPKIINFMGDSAGAGSILSFAQYLSNMDVLQPQNIVLLSPWVDLSMTNPDLYEDAKNDKMNSVDGVRYEGKLWADDLDVLNPIVSPLYGSFDKLKKISIIFGGRGILFSECRRFDKILSDANIEHDFIMYEKEGHDFALFPTQEGGMAINDIVNIIGRD